MYKDNGGASGVMRRGWGHAARLGSCGGGGVMQRTDRCEHDGLTRCCQWASVCVSRPCVHKIKGMAVGVAGGGDGAGTAGNGAVAAGIGTHGAAKHPWTT